MNFLNNLKIRNRIAIAVLLPLIGLLVFSGLRVWERNQTAGELAQLQSLASLAPSFSAVVHEMQKERGMSAGFIASKGSKFAQELPKQRRTTDTKRTALDDRLAAYEMGAAPGSFKNLLSDALKTIAKIDTKRGQVDGLKLSVPQMAGYYTGTIAKFLHTIENMSVLSTNAEVSNLISGYSAFLEAKERAGQERAMGSAGFAAEKFSPVVYQKFVSLIAAQNTYFNVFKTVATGDQKALLKNTLKGAAVDDVASMRKVALASPFKGDTGGVDATDWFKIITEKIGLLKNVEDGIATDLSNRIAAIHDDANATLMTATITTLVLVLLTLGLCTVIILGITGPIAQITDRMTALADGRLDVRIPETLHNRQDEIGVMVNAVRSWRDSARESAELRDQQESNRLKATEERKAHMHELADQLESRVGTIITGISDSTSQLESASTMLTATADQTTQQSQAVAAAAEEASVNVQTVAAASGQLSSSINEIASQVAKSSATAASAVQEAEATNVKVQGLADAAQRIGDVVALINDVAEQTNLLALNATIEAARAGEAGKGFAVVAAEVKNLANQTAKATDEIGSQIESIQGATNDSVQAIDGIGRTIDGINEIASTISAAVEEQGAATNEITRNMDEATAGTNEVSSNIIGVSQGAAETSQAAFGVREAANELSINARSLREEIDGFLEEIRTS